VGPIGNLRRPWLGIAALAIACVLPVPLPAALRAGLLAVTLGLAPGALLAPLVAPGGPATGRLLLALVLSPFLAAAPAALLVSAGLPVGAAARIVVAVTAAVALLRAFAPRPAPPAEPGERPGIVAASLWTGLVAAVLIGNRFLPPRSDGWFHAAVTLQIAARGLPVEDPAFAGLPLLYFWGSHLWAALWLALEPRLEPWTPLIALNLAGAFGTVLGVAALARRLGASARGQWAACALATLGYSPLGWVAVLARVMTGEVRGVDEIRRLITLGVDPALRALGVGTLHASLAFFGDKFLVLTPLSIGLALFVVLLLALLDAVERPGFRTAAALALVEAAALFLHTVVGLTTVLVAGAWWLTALLAPGRGEPAAPRRALIPVAAAFAAAGLALSPYLLSIAGAKHGQLANGLSARALGSWLLAGALIVPMGGVWLGAAARRRGPARVLLPLVAGLTLLALALKLPENNQSKFFNLLLLALAPAAALGWLELHDRLRGGARAALAGLLVAALVPTPGLAIWGFACERGQSDEPSHSPTPAVREAWSWCRAQLAPDAVIVDPGGASDMLVLAGRSALWGGGTLERNWGHAAPALDLRRRASRELAAPGGPSPEAGAFLSGLGRDVVLVARATGARDTAAAWNRAPREPERFRPLYRNGEIALYRWRGNR
jgi:hypothetical protein